jgi:DUF3040 family protein
MTDDDVLADLERRLAAEDPAFLARMHRTSPAPTFPSIFVLCVLLFIATPPISLLFGPSAALWASAAVGAVIAAVITRRRRR